MTFTGGGGGALACVSGASHAVPDASRPIARSATCAVRMPRRLHSINSMLISTNHVICLIYTARRHVVGVLHSLHFAPIPNPRACNSEADNALLGLGLQRADAHVH